MQKGRCFHYKKIIKSVSIRKSVNSSMSVEHVVTYFIRMHTHVVIVRPSLVGCKNVKLDKFEIKKKSNRYLCQQCILTRFCRASCRVKNCVINNIENRFKEVASRISSISICNNVKYPLIQCYVRF